MNVENISVLILLYAARHNAWEVSCCSLFHTAFMAFGFPRDPFTLIGMGLNLFSSLDLLITCTLNPPDQPLP